MIVGILFVPCSAAHCTTVTAGAPPLTMGPQLYYVIRRLAELTWRHPLVMGFRCILTLLKLAEEVHCRITATACQWRIQRLLDTREFETPSESTGAVCQ
jgi:hypothetical protein